MLIDGGANINEKTKEGFTPMYLAVIHELNDVIDQLFIKGADANFQLTAEENANVLIGLGGDFEEDGV
ncbi:MAG: hypothetical protein N4A31_06880 [Rickettsiales bacterium]|jgi:ankyrin repeat protein|nr:hypothetical protein [Rickettsiales bacterium]